MSFALRLFTLVLPPRLFCTLLCLPGWYALPLAAQSTPIFQVRQLPNTMVPVAALPSQAASFGSAAFVTLNKQSAELEIALSDGTPIQTAVILPKIFDLPFTLADGKIHVRLNSAPAHWQVVINGDSLHPLWLLASWPDATQLHRQKQTLVVSAGLHDWTKPDSLPNLSQIRRIHLRQGAVVRAQLVWQTDEPISITGSGIWLAATSEPAITLTGQKGTATLEQCVIINPAGTALAIHKPMNAFGIRVFGGSEIEPAAKATAESKWDKCLLDAPADVLEWQGSLTSMNQTQIGRWRKGSVFAFRPGPSDTVGQIHINQTTIMASETPANGSQDSTQALLSLADGGKAQYWGGIHLQDLTCEGSMYRLISASLLHAAGASRIEKLEMENVQTGPIIQPNLLTASPGNRMVLRLKQVLANGKLVLHEQFRRKGSVSLGIQ